MTREYAYTIADDVNDVDKQTELSYYRLLTIATIGWLTAVKLRDLRGSYDLIGQGNIHT